MKSYMSTFSSNRQRLDNYYKTKQKLGGSLEMFDAIDTVNHMINTKSNPLKKRLLLLNLQMTLRKKESMVFSDATCLM